MLLPVLIGRLVADFCQFSALTLKSRVELAAENLFLRKQLALYQERKAERRATSVAIRWTMTALGDGSRVRPAAGRCRRISELSSARWIGENPTWGEERIANELMLKLGIRVSPRTVANTWTWIGLVASRISVGQLLSRITQRRSLPVISSSL